MKDFLVTEHLLEEKSVIEGIPIIRFNLKSNSGKTPTIILYHGWSSNKESQRLRGFILANLGYQVIIPDAIYHGERNALEKYDAENSVKYFWPTILNNIDEANKMIDFFIQHYDTDPDRIGLIGHSMGGFTAAGVFTYNNHVKTSVVLNGSFNWNKSNQILKKMMGLEDYNGFEKEEEKINSIDPMNNQQMLVNRPILMLHGSHDSVVDIESQRVFYNQIKPLYSDKSLIQLIEYNNLDHFVTTNMMEEAAIWFKKYL
ncbi:MAG: alpha/beta fold hydrolase [Tissierellaceae bacterium]|nr:alpha/beta fold hydrolase [Tissierellaceae bacterium]